MSVENQLKATVDIRTLIPQWSIAYPIIQQIFNSRGYDCVVTSGNDSKHGERSLHPWGAALDFRSHHVAAGKAGILKAIQTALGPQWDVLLEDLDGPNEHFHVEFDPDKEPLVKET